MNSNYNPIQCTMWIKRHSGAVPCSFVHRGAQCCSYSPYAMWSIPHEVFQTFCKLGIRQITPSWPPGYSPVFSRSLQTATQIYKIFCKPENFGGLHLQDLCFFKIKMAKTTSGSVFLAIIFSGLRSILHPYTWHKNPLWNTRGKQQFI